MDGWRVNEDGTFALTTSSISLEGCYPALDGRPVRAVRVAIGRGATPTITYHLTGGARLVLSFSQEHGAFLLRTGLQGFDAAPHWVHPLSMGSVAGADQFFAQGLGFGGPSGFKTIATGDDCFLWESYALAGLTSASDECLVIGACDHRRFLCKTTLARQVTHRGLVNRHPDRHQLLLDCGFATEGIPLGDQQLVLPEIRVVTGLKPWDTFRSFAAAVGSLMGARAPARPTYHYCSWYRRGCHFDRADLDGLLGWLKTSDPHLPLQTVQIDDGYCVAAGDWLEANTQWPGGLPSAFAAIELAGYRPGIWIAPFMVGSRSRLFRDHPDWIIRSPEGAPIVEWNNYGGSAIASHHDEETYALDTSHPQAFAYLREVFRTLRSWGCTFFKTDFMDWGFKDSLSVRRHTAGKTSVEHFRDVLTMIREEIGEESYWLGCIMPFAPAIGFVDGMRIANDVGVVWGPGSTGNMIDESLADQYFNNVWWQNDPDVVFLRNRYLQLQENEIKALAYWHGILGGSISTSDFFHELPSDRLNLWYFLEPDDRPWTAMMPNWNRQRRLRVAAREYRGMDAYALVILNPLDEPVTEVVHLANDLGIESAYVFAWEPGRARRLGKLDSLAVEVPGHGAQLYFLSQWGEPPPPDLSLGGKLLSYWLIGSGV